MEADALKTTRTWDYLIVTAANDQQAQAYDVQLRERQKAGELPQVRQCLVIPDLEGRRIGSGGSTLHALACVLRCERPDVGPGSFEEAEAILSGLRILIVHAGGDSRRLTAYSHCGKMFVPIPGTGQRAGAATLFDRLVPTFLMLPEAHRGQVVVASGDALILFDPSVLKLDRPGITALGCIVSSEEASQHGVFCADKNGSVRRYLQKPSKGTLVEVGAVNEEGEAVLDLGVMSMDASAAVQMMRAFFAADSPGHGKPALEWKAEARDALFSNGIDLYREICCVLGTGTTCEQYVDALRASGSALDGALLAKWFDFLRRIPLNLEILAQCKFLHFGTTRELITSGMALLAEDSGKPAQSSLILINDIGSDVTADYAWIESCLIRERLTLEGWNAVVGVDVVVPLRLQKGASFDMSAGVNRDGERVWFFRYYEIDDTFKHSMEEGATFCGQPLQKWLEAIGANAPGIWPAEVQENEQTLWNARVFPAMKEHQEYREWLWLLDVESASPEQKRRFLTADRYSCAEVAIRVDQAEFHARRGRLLSRQAQQREQVSETRIAHLKPMLSNPIGTFPYRMALAGGWIDQPFVSKFNPAPPGSMVVVGLEPTCRFMDRAGMATSTRRIAQELWKAGLPDREPRKLVRELYEAENRGKTNPSGSQDMAGLILPGINRLDYDFQVDGGLFPAHVESCNDPDVVHWLEEVLHLLPIAQRPDGYSPLEEQHLNPEWVGRLGESGKACFEAILAKNTEKLGASLNECMRCWEVLLPHTVAHPLITVDLRGLLAFYQERYAGAMYSGCGGGYLFVVSEKPIPGACKVKVRITH